MDAKCIGGNRIRARGKQPRKTQPEGGQKKDEQISDSRSRRPHSHPLYTSTRSDLSKQYCIYTPNYPQSIWAMPEYVVTGLMGSLAIPVHGPKGCSGILAVSWFHTAPAQLPDSNLHLAQLLADMLGAAWHRKGVEQHLEQIATCDVLTGVPNRYQLEERILAACARAQHNEHMFAVILLDLDGFKGVNDAMGHQAGDRLLREVVSRLQDVIRSADVLIRYAGDEFVLLVENLHRLRNLEELMTRIMTALRIRMGFDEQRVGITVSAGIRSYARKWCTGRLQLT